MAHGVIVAGGSGVRMGRDRPKQYLPLGGRPILSHTIEAFLNCTAIETIRLVVPEPDAAFCRTDILDRLRPRKPVRIVAGGDRRQDSVRNGLADLEPVIAAPDTPVAIHDGVRPLVRPTDIDHCLATARDTGACILGVPAVDTLKRVTPGGIIRETLSRTGVWYAQTPQAFHFRIIHRAHEAALSAGIQGTDDASLVERMGIEVSVIEGSRSNLKITTPDDLALAAAILSRG